MDEQTVLKQTEVSEMVGQGGAFAQISEELRDFEITYPRPVNVIEVLVEFDSSDMLNSLAEAYEEEIARIQRVIYKDSGSLRIDKESLIDYFEYTLSLRIKLSTSNRGPDWHLHREFSRTAKIPVLWTTVLLQVGIATDKTYGIKLKPVMSKSFLERRESNFKDKDFIRRMIKISDELALIEDRGLRVTIRGIPDQVLGSLEFMTLVRLSNDQNIFSYRTHHPVHAYLSSFLLLKGVESVVGKIALRIDYGSVDQWRNNLSTMIGSLRNRRSS